MDYDREQLESIIRVGCEQLFEKQPMLFNPENDIHERTVSGELAGVLRNEFLNLHLNCEYNRMTDEYGIQIPKRIHLDPDFKEPSRVYPDIIIHRQEDGEHNLLIIEMKMSWKNADKEHDFHKLTSYVRELNYRFGLYLELGKGTITEMRWFE